MAGKTISQIKPTRRRKITFVDPCTSPVKLAFSMQQTREAANLSLRDVAKASGVSSATCCRAEAGMNTDLATALRLAAFYEKKVEEIWRLR